MAHASTFNEKLKAAVQSAEITPKIKAVLKIFIVSYSDALKSHGIELENHHLIFDTYLELIKKQLKDPFVFEPYHKSIRKPFDHYKFGVDFMTPLVDEKHSTVIGHDHLQQIVSHLKQGHNVVFLANHQIEADPQAISILLNPFYPAFAENLIFVAGERVITDPLAVPFSMGCNLLCIYSKRYIDNPPESKAAKQLHNKKTMELMSSLLKEGGKAIYVAPSGGRDRQNAHGVVEVARFDPQSIEMFYLMAKKAGTPTFFYPMALSTYDLLPPPETIQLEIGETRQTKRGSIHLAVGEAINMEQFPGSENPNKQERRQARAAYIYSLVCKDYQKLVG